MFKPRNHPLETKQKERQKQCKEVNTHTHMSCPHLNTNNPTTSSPSQEWQTLSLKQDTESHRKTFRNPNLALLSRDLYLDGETDNFHIHRIEKESNQPTHRVEPPFSRSKLLLMICSAILLLPTLYTNYIHTYNNRNTSVNVFFCFFLLAVQKVTNNYKKRKTNKQFMCNNNY